MQVGDDEAIFSIHLKRSGGGPDYENDALFEVWAGNSRLGHYLNPGEAKTLTSAYLDFVMRTMSNHLG